MSTHTHLHKGSCLQSGNYFAAGLKINYYDFWLKKKNDVKSCHIFLLPPFPFTRTVNHTLSTSQLGPKAG